MVEEDDEDDDDEKVIPKTASDGRGQKVDLDFDNDYSF